MTPALYPALFSNPLLCPCPGHFAETKCAESGPKRTAESSREAGRSPQPPGDSLCIALDASEAKPRSATIAHKCPNAAFQLLGGVRMPPSSQTQHKPPHRADTGGLCLGDSRRGSQLLAEIICRRSRRPHFISPKLFENISFGPENFSLITAG